jgi:hypothetical protein
MSLWDDMTKGKEKSKNNNEVATTVGERDQQTEIRNLGGFKDISDVANAAKTRPQKDKTLTSGTVSSARKEQMEIEAKVKLEMERRARARETVGKHIMSRIASVPYEAWAAFAGEEFLNLSEPEQKNLAEQYFLLAEAGDFNFDRWYWILGGIIIANVKLVTVRVNFLMEKKQKEELTDKLSNDQKIAVGI